MRCWRMCLDDVAHLELRDRLMRWIVVFCKKVSGSLASELELTKKILSAGHSGKSGGSSLSEFLGSPVA